MSLLSDASFIPIDMSLLSDACTLIFRSITS
jgi:hypothetical protein